MPATTLAIHTVKRGRWYVPDHAPHGTLWEYRDPEGNRRTVRGDKQEALVILRERHPGHNFTFHGFPLKRKRPY